MTITAAQANQFTLDTIANNTDRDVSDEAQRAESQIRNEVGRENFETAYNALIIGNPNDDPIEDDNLTAEQILFRDHFTGDGYKVSRDPINGFWLLNWAQVGAEIITSVYSVRTTVTPGAIAQQTIDVVDNYFNTLNLRATSETVFNGDIMESDFGAPDSVFYEYTSKANQQDDVDNSTGVKNALRASGLGYVDDTRITGVGGATNTTSPTNTIDIGNGTTTVTITVGGTGTAVDLVTAINSNATLLALGIVGDINGPDVLIINNLAGTLIATNNVGNVLADIFALANPQTGILMNNTEVYKLA
jgi:hypothetical protein